MNEKQGIPMTHLFVLLALLITVSGAIQGEVPSSNVDTHHFIRNWLLCGPFPNPLAEGVLEYRHDETTLGYYIDYLAPIGGEEAANPEEGLEFTSGDGETYRWQVHEDSDDYIDLVKVFEKNQKTVAYAACNLISDSPKRIALGLGSNDGIKAWLNGKLVWDHHLPRGADSDQDCFFVDVRQGANLLLLKIDQGIGLWGFYARTIDINEKRAELTDPSNLKGEIKYKVKGNQLRVWFCRHSPLRILEPPPECEVSITSLVGGISLTEKTRVGECAVFELSDLSDGPYLVKGSAILLDQRLDAEDFYYHGKSNLLVCFYDREGRPPSNVEEMKVEMLDEELKTVEGAIRFEEPGSATILRPDLSSFSLRILLESASLGRHWLVADNGGKGFTIPEDGKLDIDLPQEVAADLRLKVQDLLAEHHSIPGCLRKQLKKRLKMTEIAADAPPARVFEIIDLLSTTKAKIAPSGPITVWYAPGIEKVAQEETVPAIETESAHVSLAKNEYEPFQIVLQSDRDRTGLSVEVSPATSENGFVLDASNIAIDLVEYVNVETVTDHFGTLGPWPDPLPPLGKSFPVKGGMNTPLWITVYAPPEQPAGVYCGTFAISEGDEILALVPIEIEVFDFVLPTETSTHTAYGVSVNRDYHGPITDDQWREVHDKYMQLCRSRRISPYSPHAGSEIEIRIEGLSQRAVLDFTEFDRAMSRYLDEFKFNSFRMGNLPGELGGHSRYSKEYNGLFGEIYGAVQEHLREKGWLDEAYWYWVDEPPISEYADVRKGMELLKESCPDMRRLLTCNQEKAPVPYFHDTVNLWVPIMDRYDPERAHARQALGEEIWWYVCTGPKAPYPNNFIDHPAINHRIRFWMIDKYGLDGSLYWSVTYWRQNPWEQAMALNPEGGPWGNGDGRLLYPPRRLKPTEPVVEPPVSSIRFDSLRDGLEDREYLLMLRGLSDREGEKAEKAKTLLESAFEELVPQMTYYEQNPAMLLAARERIARLLAE